MRFLQSPSGLYGIGSVTLAIFFSGPTWGDPSPSSTPPGQAGSAASSPGLIKNKPQILPAALLLQTKLTTNDDPHLSAKTRAAHVCSTLTGSYRFCVSPQGDVDSVESVDGNTEADADILSALKKWRFKPRTKPACAVQTFDFEIPGPGDLCTRSKDPNVQSREWLAQRRIGGDKLQWPGTRAAPVNSTLAYKLCVGKDGTVTSVKTVKGNAATDQYVTDVLRRWRYEALPAPACAFEFFRFPNEDGPEPATPPAVPGDAVASAGTSANGNPERPGTPAKKKISQDDDPHLPDAVKKRFLGTAVLGRYKVCIAKDGSITSVDPMLSIRDADESIIATLLTWRYEPRPAKLCFVQMLEFHIE